MSEDADSAVNLDVKIAIAGVSQRLIEGGKTIDEVIAALRATVEDTIKSMRAELVINCLREGPADMQTISERAAVKGAKIHAAQAMPVLEEAIKAGDVVDDKVKNPSGGRSRSVYRLKCKHTKTRDHNDGTSTCAHCGITISGDAG